MKETFENFQNFWKMAMPIQNKVEKSKILEMKEELSTQLKSNIMWICYRNNEGEHEVIRASYGSKQQQILKIVDTVIETTTCKLFDIDNNKWKKIFLKS